jgi:glycosyltransferase involved in cell wall biosynthesis
MALTGSSLHTRAKPPWLSVVLCTYQGARFLRTTLTSLASEPLEGVEILAVDDGSTDATPDILRAFEAMLPLRTIPIPHTGNWVANTNHGLRAACGDFCCLLHQDDTWLPGRLIAVRSLLSVTPEVGVIAGPSHFIDATGRTVGHWRPPLPSGRALPAEFVLERLIVQNFFALPAPVFKRTLALSVGLLDESLWFLADWKFWAQLIGAGGLVCYPEPRTAFRLHAASQTASRTHDEADLHAQYDNVIACIRGLLPCGAGVARATSAAELNRDVSIGLALWSHGQRLAACRVLARGLCRSPTLWPRFIHNSRIIERVGARLRVGATQSP